MKPPRPGDGELALAVFIDFENLAHGFQGRRDRFQIEKILERLVEKGKIVVKKAYCDWSRFGQYTAPLHEAAIELIEIPKRSSTGKNSADIRLVVDAIDLAYSKDHIDTFVIVSGDSDFSPLVSKLKELGKHVIGLGLANATSNLLRDNCDEFIYYEDLEMRAGAAPTLDDRIPEAKRKVFALLLDSLLALRRENKEVLHSSMIKDTMKRKKPSFNEGYHGYATFSDLLIEAEKNGLVELSKGKQSGTLIVTRFQGEMNRPAGNDAGEPAAVPPSGDAKRRRRGRGGRSRGRGDGKSSTANRPDDDEVPLGRQPAAMDDEEPLELPSYRPSRSAEPKTEKLPRIAMQLPAELKPAAVLPVPRPARRADMPKRDEDVFGAGIE